MTLGDVSRRVNLRSTQEGLRRPAQVLSTQTAASGTYIVNHSGGKPRQS